MQGSSLIPVTQDLQIFLREDLVVPGVPVYLAVLEEQAAQRLLVDGPVSVELLAHRPEAALLDDELLQPALRVRAQEELFLHGALRGDAVDDNGARLSDAVASVLRL